MLKKLVVVGSGAVLLLGLFFGRDTFSYVSTGWHKMHQSVHDSVPITFQIERARKMIKDLDGPIAESARVIAREEVAIDKLQSQIDKNEADLAKAENNIKRLNDDLKQGGSTFVYAGRSYSEKQVKTDLEHRFARFQTAQETTNKLEQILTARQNGLLAAREKYDAMLAARRQLEVDVENLEARMKLVEVAQTCSHVNVDDSQLARTKDLLNDIGSRISVAEKMVGAEAQYQGQIKLDDEVDSTDITQRVTQYFNAPSAEDGALVKLD
jgi:septal ring factor EnvC (AmiA/AmiB activator)